MRVLIVSVLLGSTVFLNNSLISSTAGQKSFFLVSLIVATYVLTILYALWYRQKKNLHLLAYIQLSGDALLAASLVYLTGGVVSGFTFLFHLWIMVAAIVIGKNATYFQATISAVLLVIIAMMYGRGFIPFVDEQVYVYIEWITLIYYLLVNIFSMYLVGALVNILVSRIEVAGEGLKIERERKQELLKELEQAKRLAVMGEFAATLAHEIRNPLAAVSGSFQMLNSKFDQDESSIKLTAIVEKELKRIERIVNDMLDYTRPVNIEIKRFNLCQLISDVITLVKAGGINGEIKFECSRGNELFIMGDLGQLKQVLWNLINNGIQSKGSELFVTVTISVTVDDDNVQIRVNDNGKGVPAELSEDIFAPFFSTKKRGIGLGLALCKRVIEVHKGKICVENPGVEGATFLIVLPYKK
ncbi:MAG: hypothetical protein JXR91_09135 [Deltaproteobacteria bacterium]|nr:hypothetical protein [Deltaproteobacteria bacterium]